MKKLSIFILLTAMLAGVACASGQRISPSKNKTTKNMTVKAFDRIDVSSAIDVVYKQTSSNDCSVSISAPENIMQYVKVTQRNGKLTLGIDRSLSLNGSPEIKITIKSPTLKDIELSGASTFEASSINCPGQKFEIDLSGASTLKINKLIARTIEIDGSGASSLKISGVTATNIETDLSGASNLELSGKATSVEYDASGASNIKASNLKATNGKLDASGASRISASVKEVFYRSATGASSISVN